MQLISIIVVNLINVKKNVNKKVYVSYNIKKKSKFKLQNSKEKSNLILLKHTLTKKNVVI